MATARRQRKTRTVQAQIAMRESAFDEAKQDELRDLGAEFVVLNRRSIGPVDVVFIDMIASGDDIQDIRAALPNHKLICVWRNGKRVKNVGIDKDEWVKVARDRPIRDPVTGEVTGWRRPTVVEWQPEHQWLGWPLPSEVEED